ncbi:MAG TPA: ABC transporter permease [Puia sp.]|nr:ABC transporter permease [Puia sp.]
MLKNYIKTALRNFQRHRLHAFINIGGLALGMASFIVILIYLNYELSYDKWDASLKRVYKISMRQDRDLLANTPAPLASFLLEKYPGVEAATAFVQSGDYEALLSSGEKSIYQKGLVETDSSFFKVFPYKLVLGNAATALDPPNAIVISEEVGRKLFGNNDPIGKPIKLYNVLTAVVTGVFRQPPGPSHLTVHLLMRSPSEKSNKFWENYSYQTYVKLRQPVSVAKLGEGMSRIFSEARKAPATGLFADAVEDIHNFPQHGESHFTITVVLLVLAVFILIAGAINFSNLSLARAMTRAKEVGIRKVLGSGKKHIVLQSLLEISLQCLISLALALLLVNRTLPYFSSHFNLPAGFFKGQNALLLGAQLGACLLLIILISGMYPALFLSGFRTAEVLKGKYTRGKGGLFFRNSLLIVQLSLSALFITGIIVVNRQVSYMQNEYLGFEPAKVVRIEATQKTRDRDFEQVRQSLLSVPGVEYVAKSTSVPGSSFLDTSTNTFKYEGGQYRLNSVKVGTDYFNVMDIQLMKGRFFSDRHPEDADHSAIINETALKKLGIADPTGRYIYFPYCDTFPYTIVGVVKDFHIQGLQHAIEPTIYTISNAHCEFRSGGSVLVKVKTDHVQQTLAGIQAVWKKQEPDFPIRYAFLDQDFQRLLTEYIRLQRIIFFFSIVSLVITGIGLFALTSFLCRQRVKEIGVRKVLGASVAGVAMLLSRDFLKILIISVAIALPLAGWALSRWLESFAYRVSLSWWMFALAGLITMGVTLLTVCVQAVRSASANPVKSLRTE